MQEDLHGWIDEIDQKDVRESELIHGNEVAKERKRKESTIN
jgi:hypothetical protein